MTDTESVAYFWAVVFGIGLLYFVGKFLYIVGLDIQRGLRKR
jgi:hypothetical protein